MSDPKIRKLLFGVLLIGFGAYAVISGIINATDNKQPLIAPSGSLSVEIVDTVELRRQGLSGREHIGDRDGMLFVFDEANDQNCFWMKDMLISIDMVWMDSDKKVLNTALNASPESYPDAFCPEGDAKYGLEVGAGRAEALGLTPGEQVRF